MMSASSSEKSKKGHDSEKAGGHEGGQMETQTLSAKKAAGKKKRSNLFLRVGEKVGVVEQTRIAPEFMSAIEQYFKYYDVADNLVDGIECVLQPNLRILATEKIAAPINEDPFEEAANNTKAILQMYSHESDTNKLLPVIADCFQKLAVLHREIQLNGRRTIRRLRRFVSKDQLQMLEEQQRLMLARDIMDSARHDLKQTKTSEEVEHYGKLYEAAVHEFDVQAAKVETFTITLPPNKICHAREVYQLFDLLGKYHVAVAKTLNEHLVTTHPYSKELEELEVKEKEKKPKVLNFIKLRKNK